MLTYFYRKLRSAYGADEAKRRGPRDLFYVGIDPLLDPDFDDMDTTELTRNFALLLDQDEDGEGEIATGWRDEEDEAIWHEPDETG